MPSFHCKIGTADGRIVEKTYQSVTKTQLKENLEEQGFHVFQIRRKVLWFFQGRGGNPSCVSGRRFISFNQEMLVLLKSGLPILQIFDTQIEQMEGGLSVMPSAKSERKSGEEVPSRMPLSNTLNCFHPCMLLPLKPEKRPEI